MSIAPPFLGAPLFLAAAALAAPPAPEPGTVILEDAFDRAEADDAKEEVGNGWRTNSKARAAGNKQVDLDAGALHVTRHPVADHSVSVVHEAAFRDATITLRFKLAPGAMLKVNLADLGEKSVHAGHLCAVHVRQGKVTLEDLKTGRMKSEIRARRQSKSVTPADRDLLKTTTREFPVKTAPGEWHTLSVTVAGDTLSAAIDGAPVGELAGPGVAHPTKRLLRLGVEKEVWIDDVRVVAG